LRKAAKGSGGAEQYDLSRRKEAAIIGQLPTPRKFAGFADEFRSAHQPIIDPEKFSKALHIQLQDLAKMAGVHRTTVTENPTNAKLQGYLREGGGAADGRRPTR